MTSNIHQNDLVILNLEGDHNPIFEVEGNTVKTTQITMQFVETERWSKWVFTK